LKRLILIASTCYSPAVRAEIAHQAERRTRNAQVPGSIPGLGFRKCLREI